MPPSLYWRLESMSGARFVAFIGRSRRVGLHHLAGGSADKTRIDVRKRGWLFCHRTYVK